MTDLQLLYVAFFLLTVLPAAIWLLMAAVEKFLRFWLEAEEFLRWRLK